ncbi:MAG: SET domain-containing protein-lysine N-methyltransferase [Proteobacteria bacterium]|nr:SET domain-containing protein-lysine N-methyltransferase [Pseudomonadota bacterium]
MMHVQYKLDKSPLHGIGLFAAQPIKQGALIYSASPILDVNISSEQFESLTEAEKSEVRFWGFWIEDEQVWHVDFDVSKFINHDRNSTVTQDGDHKDAYLVATRDIKSGEELTQNYLEFETEADLRQRGISD